MDNCACAEIPYDPISRISLVKKDNEVVGISYVDLLTENQSVGEQGTFEEIRLSRILSSSTNMISFIADMPTDFQYYYLVISSTKYVGSLELSDLVKMPFRLCILALTLDLEKKIVQYVRKDPDTSWDYLSVERQKFAMSLFRSVSHRSCKQLSMNKPRIEILLDYTSFSDKCKILKSYNVMTPYHDIIDNSIEFRNSCSHSTDDNKFISEISHIE